MPRFVRTGVLEERKRSRHSRIRADWLRKGCGKLPLVSDCGSQIRGKEEEMDARGRGRVADIKNGGVRRRCNVSVSRLVSRRGARRHQTRMSTFCTLRVACGPPHASNISGSFEARLSDAAYTTAAGSAGRLRHVFPFSSSFRMEEASYIAGLGGGQCWHQVELDSVRPVAKMSILIPRVCIPECTRSHGVYFAPTGGASYSRRDERRLPLLSDPAAPTGGGASFDA